MLCFAFSFSAFSQNSALTFDGDNDFVEVHPMPGIGQFSPDAFSIEFIFEKGERQNSIEVLFYQENQNGFFEFGLKNGISPYVSFNSDLWVFEDCRIDPLSCTHLSLTYGNESLSLYLNGQLAQTQFASLSSQPIVENTPFFIGQRHPVNATSFSGRMEDMRIFQTTLSPAEISQRLFQEVEVTAIGKYLHLPLHHYLPTYTCDPFNPRVHGFLGGFPSIFSYTPLLSEDVCIISISPESIDPNCQTDPGLMPPSCSTTNLAANEMLCNGDFEQYCNILNTPPSSFYLPEQAFTDFPYTGSDVVNWEVPNYIRNAQLYSTPDFYVRDGFGSPNQMQPLWLAIPGGNNVLCIPPTDTHNGSGDAIVGLIAHPPLGGENLLTTLRNPIIAGNLYSFSGWFYNGGMASSAGCNGIPPTGTVQLKVYFGDGLNQSQEVLALISIVVQDANLLSTNNGWQFISGSFIAPASMNGLTHMIVEANSQVYRYMYLDNLSLLNMGIPSPTSFPAYLNTGDANDVFKRIIKEDAFGNIYIAGQIIDPSSSQLQFGLQTVLATHNLNTQAGSFVAKYDSDGNYIWSYFQEYVMINDIEIVNNEVIAVGYTEPMPAGVLANTPFHFNGNAVLTGAACTGGTQPIHNTENMMLSRLNANTGNLLGTIEVWGGSTNERAIGVEIFGNTAKIALWACQVNNPIPLSWTTVFTTSSNSILEYNLSLYSCIGGSLLPSIFPPDYLIDFNSDGSNWYLLTNQRLIKQGGTFSALPPISGQSYSAHELYVTSTGDLYLAYNQNIGNPPYIEKRNASLAVIGNFSAPLNSTPLTSHAIPISISADASSLFVAYEYLSSNSPMNQQLHIEKYDPNTMTGTSIWSSGVLTNGIDARFAGVMGGEANRPMDMVQRAIGGLAVLGNFVTDNTSWTWNLPPKSLNYSGTPALPSGQHSFVAVVNDLGNSAVFGKGENGSDIISQKKTDLLVYPNPLGFNKILNIRSSSIIEAVDIYNLQGQKVFSTLVLDQPLEIMIPLNHLETGLYFIQVKNQSGRSDNKFIIE